MPYDPYSATDGVFASAFVSPYQQSQMANGALSSALGFYQKKDYSRAEAEFKRAIGLDPSNATQAYNYLGNTYQAMKKPDQAIKAYKASLAQDPTQDKAHLSMANIYLQKKDYTKAEKEFKEAIKLNPTDTVAPYTLGQMYQQQGKYTDAENQFKKVIRMAPNDPNPYYALGTTLNKEGKYSAAVTQLTQAIRLRPKMAAAHLELGTAYSALGDTANAQREVDTLTRLDATQGALLKASIAKPKMVAIGGLSSGDMASALGPNTQLFALDISLLPPNTSREFSMTFFFDSKMDGKSVQDPSNWTINKATGGAAGYYNNTLPVSPAEAYIPQNPTRVTYDPDKQTATVSFLLSQNSDGNATIDPSHMVFKFSGKDVKGKTMDSSADQFDGFAQFF